MSWLVVAVLITIGLGLTWWRYSQARSIADRWLAEHRYSVRWLKRSYLSGPMRFRLTPFRNNDWAVDFRAEVDDLRLGGTGIVRLRVWTDWLGLIDREPEVSWDRMPTDETGVKSTETQWHDTQVALLRRVGAGESVFRPEGREPAQRAEFDLVVEHVLALGHRGLIRCATPIAELRSDAQYAAVTDVHFDGRRSPRARARGFAGGR